MLKTKRMFALLLALVMICANVPWEAAASAWEQGEESPVANVTVDEAVPEAPEGDGAIGSDDENYSPRVEDLFFTGLPAQIQAGEAVLPTDVSVEGEATIQSMRWVDEDNNLVTVLETGKDYYLELKMAPNDGYAFYDGLGAYNHATGFWSHRGGFTGDGYAVVDFKYSLKPDAGEIVVEITGVAPGADVEQVSVNISGKAVLEQVIIDDPESWDRVEAGKFEDEKRYYFYAEILPAEGYTFTRDTKITVFCDGQNWNADVWDFGVLTVDVYYDFRAPAVRDVYAEGLPEKVEPGEVVIPEIKVDGNAQVKEIRWVDTDKQPVTELEWGKVYYLEVTFTPVEGYAFRDWVDTNGSDYTIESAQELKVYWSYSLLPDVGRVDVTISGVEVGKSVEDVAVTVDGKATLGKVEIWCEGVDEPIESGEFQPEQFYRVHVVLFPEEGYCFTDENRPYVNGQWDGDCGQSTAGDYFWSDTYYDFRAPRVEYVWLAGEPTDIEPGAAPVPEMYIEDGAAQITGFTWYDAEENVVTSFEEGKDYYLAVTLSPADGFAFRDWLKTNADHLIIDAQTAIVYYSYSLKPEITDINVTVSGLEQGARIEDLVVDIAGQAQFESIYIHNETIGEQMQSGVFEKDNYYYIELCFIPAEGYRFAREMDPVFQGYDRYDWGVAMNGSALRFYIYLDLRDPQVEEIWIEGLPEKIEAGKAQKPSLSVEGNARIVSATWVDEDDKPVSTFAAGKNYYLKVKFAPENGYVFREWVDINAYSYRIISENELEAEFIYSLIPDVGLVEVTVSGIEPGMPVDGIQIDVNGQATVAEVFIHNNTIGEAVSDGNFEAENTYDVAITLIPGEGYRFTDENRPLVNGSEDYGWNTNVLGTYFTIYYYCDLRTPAVNELHLLGLPERFDMTPGAAALPELTVDGDAKITGVRWLDADGQPVNAFVTGKDYYLEVALEPTNGFVFRDYIDFLNYNYNDDCEIVSENKAIAYFYYSLKPVCQEIRVDVSGLTPGNSLSDIVANVSGGAKLEQIGVWDDYSGEYLGKGKLESGKFYYFRAEITVAEGYRFSDETSMYFNGEDGVDYHLAGDKLYIYYYFNTCKEITSADLSLGTVKIGASIANATLTVPKGANYTVEYRWFDNATWEEVTGKFKDGCKYTLEYRLIPNDGYAFAKGMKVTVNGEVKDAWISANGGECQGNLIYSYYQKISKVELPALPTSIKKGSKLPTGFKVSSNKYSLEYVWVNINEDNGEEELVKADKDGTYVLQWGIRAAKGYEFTSDTVVYVDGKKYTSAIIGETEVMIFKVFNINVPEITRLDLTVPDPVAGQKPGKITAPADAKYKVGGAYWAQNGTGNFFDSDVEVVTFKNGQYVMFSMEMEAEEGYAFATDLEIYINGKKVSDPLIMNVGYYGAFAVNLGVLGQATVLQAPVVKVEGQQLTWADSGAAGYEIHRATSKSGKYTKVTTVTDTVWQDTTATTGKTYYYKVKAISAAGSKYNSGFSKVASVAYPLDAPEISVSFNDTTGKVIVSWEKIAGAKSYDVYRTDWAGFEAGKFTKLGNTKSTSYTDTKAEVGIEYFYRVVAVGSSSTYNSSYSNTYMSCAKCATPVVKVAVDKATGKPSLSWGKINGAVNYSIYRQLSGEEEFTLIAQQTEVTFIDTSAPLDSKCTYYVQAMSRHEGCNSPYSNKVTESVALGIPQVAGYIDVDGRPAFTWQSVEGAVKYEIYRSTKATSGFKVIDTVEELYEYVDQTASVGKTYYYQVVAVGENTKSKASNAVKLVPTCAVPVADLTTDQKSGRPVIYWEKVSGAKSYDIYYATSANGTYKKLANTKSNSYIDTKLAVGATRYYKVKAVASKSSYNSAFSRIVSGMGFCASPVVKTSVDAATGKPSLSWSKIKEASSYRILRIRTGYESDFVELTTITGTSFIDTTAPIDTRCIYMVQAMHKTEALSSAFSPVQEVVSGIARPAVKGSIDAATGKFVLTWGAVEGAVKYEVFRSTKSNKGFTSLGTVEGLTFEDASAPGKTYYYKVTAIGAVGKSADMTALKLVGKCAAPVIAVENAANGKPSLSWEKVTGAKKYTVYRATSETGKYSKVGTTTKLTYVDSKATAGKTYFYKVVANASSSKYDSSYSNAVGCVVLCATPNVKVTYNAQGQPTISWSKVSGAKEYRIIYQTGYEGTGGRGCQGCEDCEICEYYGCPGCDCADCICNNPYGLATCVTTTKTSYTFTDVNVGMFGWVQVIAVAADEACNSQAADADIEGKPATVKLSGKVGASGKPVLTWNHGTDVIIYEVYRSTKSGSGYKLIGEVDLLGEEEGEPAAIQTYEDTTAVKGKTYYYKVVAKSWWNESAMSSAVKIKSK